jgi:hypothetical protein
MAISLAIGKRKDGENPKIGQGRQPEGRAAVDPGDFIERPGASRAAERRGIATGMIEVENVVASQSPH